nr:hypothetical protein [uncultured Schaedlerella sp.]
MGQEKKTEYAGNLLEEIQEIDKIICSDTGHYVENTHTRNCAAVLTIYCC